MACAQQSPAELSLHRAPSAALAAVRIKGLRALRAEAPGDAGGQRKAEPTVAATTPIACPPDRFRLHGTLRRSLNLQRMSLVIAWQQGPFKCSNCLVMPSGRQAQRLRMGTAEQLPGGDIFVDLLSR